MGEKAPFDDPTETHGYCVRHTAQLLATLPSHAFPDVDLLIVVRRRDQALFDYLQSRLVGVRGCLGTVLADPGSHVLPSNRRDTVGVCALLKPSSALLWGRPRSRAGIH